MPSSITAVKNNSYAKESKNYTQVQWHNPDPRRILSSGKLHPEFARRLSHLIENAHAQGLDIMIFEGYRGFEEQNKTYAKGRTQPGKKVTNAKGGESWHNYGLAVDIVFYDKKGSPSWSEKNDWTKLGKLGKELGLKWGGDWGWDKPHFEYHPELNMKKAQELHNKGGQTEVWKKVGYPLISV